MNKEQFRLARALVRANGLYALRWLPTAHALVMHALAHQQEDYLSERAWHAKRVNRVWTRTSFPGVNMIRLVPCPSQRSPMHRATLERTAARVQAEAQAIAGGNHA